MKLRHVILLPLFFCAWAMTALAQPSSGVVKVRTEEPIYKLKQGAAVQIAVVLDIENGYHINSNRPLQAFLIATSLKLDPLKGLTTSRIVYPKAVLKKFAFSPKPMSVYEGRAVLRFTARATTLAKGAHTLRGQLRVQACNDEKCLLPRTIDVGISLEVM